MGQRHVPLQLGQAVPQMLNIVVGAGGFSVCGGELIEDVASISPAT